jgi:hypothetical protein
MSVRGNFELELLHNVRNIKTIGLLERDQTHFIFVDKYENLQGKGWNIVAQ